MRWSWAYYTICVKSWYEVHRLPGREAVCFSRPGLPVTLFLFVLRLRAEMRAPDTSMTLERPMASASRMASY